jgi:hypothetical protein
LTTQASKSADALKKLHTRGHEIAYLADRFEGFQGQSQATQLGRLKEMKQKIQEASLSTITVDDFHSPSGSQDKITEAVLNQLGFSSFISYMGTYDVRVPIALPRIPGALNPMETLIVLPQTISGPEDLMSEGDPQDGLKQFIAELKLSREMSSLSVVRFPSQSLLAKDELSDIFNQIKSGGDNTWFVTGEMTAKWWRERERVSIGLDSKAGVPRLTVTVDGNIPLKYAPSVVINLPYPNDSLQLVADGHKQNAITNNPIDQWRSAVTLEKLVPGTYSWLLYFSRSTLSVTQ